MEPTEKKAQQLQQVAELTENYIKIVGGVRPLSVREFAGRLNIHLQDKERISHATIHNWRNGIHLPNQWTIWKLTKVEHPTWIADYANQLMTIING